LWKHKKTCVIIKKENIIIDDIKILTSLVKELIQNNNDLQKQMADLIINNKNDKNED